MASELSLTNSKNLPAQQPILNIRRRLFPLRVGAASVFDKIQIPQLAAKDPSS